MISHPSLEKLKEANIQVYLAQHGSILELVEAARNQALTLAE
jgi:predicted Fe-Mo cluster-binding NifX family protein